MRETKKCNDKELLVRERYREREREREDTSYLHGLNKEETLQGTSVQATSEESRKFYGTSQQLSTTLSLSLFNNFYFILRNTSPIYLFG